ncbi:MAG: metal ABC transporter permease [Lentisphaerae bacterium]|nr:metal ABC transporter permease [Lentisphaerota bacterium]
MKDFFSLLFDPDVSFLRYSFLVGILAGPAFGIIGTFVVARRISYVAGAISHSVLAGIGAALFLSGTFGWGWCNPMVGAAIAALISALIIGWASSSRSDREDSVIGATWAIGMAIGLILISVAPGYVDPMSYLFGNILLITRADIFFVALFDIVVITLAFLFYNKLLAVSFDPDFAGLRGIKVNLYYMILLCLTALTIVLLVRIVGIVMVIAMLTLPAATAGLFCNKLWSMSVTATLLSIFQTACGIFLSVLWNLPSGPMIIVVAGLVYFAALFVRRRIMPG